MIYIIFAILFIFVVFIYKNIQIGKRNKELVEQKALHDYLGWKRAIVQWSKEENEQNYHSATICRNALREQTKIIQFAQLYTIKNKEDALKFSYAKQINNLHEIDNDAFIGDTEFTDALLKLEKQMLGFVE